MIDEQGFVKLCDFNLAALSIRKKDDSAQSFCGSPIYISPEILNQRKAYKSSDYYSLGVVTYEMLFGDPPFLDDNIDGLYNKIKQGSI